MSGDAEAEIVDETCDADGAAAILFLPDGEAEWHRVAAGIQPSGQDDLLL